MLGLVLFVELKRTRIELGDNYMHFPDGKEFDVGVVVGRFQVPEFHEGHKYLLDNVIASHKYMLVCVGVSPVIGTKNDPMDYLTRMEMLRNLYPQAIVYPITDVHDDGLWSVNLDSLIEDVFPSESFTIRMYGGRDSFLKQYKGRHPKFEVPDVTNCSGTAVRAEILKPIDSPDFRRGLIYAANRKQFPTIVTTVDIAMTRMVKTGYEAIMGKKPNSNLLRFPGGFVSINDTCFEMSARRELEEETGMASNDMHYIGSYHIKDWRYSGPNEKLFTAFFWTPYFCGTPKANDDLACCEWVNLEALKTHTVVEEHHILVHALKNYLTFAAHKTVEEALD